VAGADVAQDAGIGEVDDAVGSHSWRAEGIARGAFIVLDGINGKRACADGRLADVGVGTGEQPSAVGIGLGDSQAREAAGGDNTGKGAQTSAGSLQGQRSGTSAAGQQIGVDGEGLRTVVADLGSCAGTCHLELTGVEGQTRGGSRVQGESCSRSAKAENHLAGIADAIDIQN